MCAPEVPGVRASSGISGDTSTHCSRAAETVLVRDSTRVATICARTDHGVCISFDPAPRGAAHCTPAQWSWPLSRRSDATISAPAEVSSLELLAAPLTRAIFRRGNRRSLTRPKECLNTDPGRRGRHRTEPQRVTWKRAARSPGPLPARVAPVSVRCSRRRRQLVPGKEDPQQHLKGITDMKARLNPFETPS